MRELQSTEFQVFAKISGRTSHWLRRDHVIPRQILHRLLCSPPPSAESPSQYNFKPELQPLKVASHGTPFRAFDAGVEPSIALREIRSRKRTVPIIPFHSANALSNSNTFASCPSTPTTPTATTTRTTARRHALYNREAHEAVSRRPRRELSPPRPQARGTPRRNRN